MTDTPTRSTIQLSDGRTLSDLAMGHPDGPENVSCRVGGAWEMTGRRPAATLQVTSAGAL